MRYHRDYGSAEERFWKKVNKTPDCWEWIRCLSSYGYGKFALNGESITAHRVAFYLEHGRFPEKFLLHKCDNRRCVRPSHLWEGTQADNMHDAIAKGRHNSAINARKTHCRHGHPFLGENLYVYKNGRRVCKTCRRRNDRKRWAKNQALCQEPR